MKKTKIEIPKKKLAEFCQAHHIQTLSFFGSVLRDDFGPERYDSIDIAVLWDTGDIDFPPLINQLKKILGR